MPLFPHQRILFKEAAIRQFLFLQMMRGGAKTTSLARFAIDYALIAPVPIIFTGPSFKQSLMMFDECLRILEREERNDNSAVKLRYELIGDPKRNSIDALIRFSNGATIRALPMGDGSKIRGYRGGVLIIDEAYQITEEMYTSHLAPFAGVMMAGRKSKIILSTTSWYQDCFMYRRLLQIAAEVKRGNPAYGILDFNLQDLARTQFPLDPAVWKDARRHSGGPYFAMTYFNIWPRSTARWYSQAAIDGALDAKHNVQIEKKRSDDDSVYYGVFDLAASEDGDSTFATVYKYENSQSRAVYAYEKKGLGPNERAFLAHELDRRFDFTYIVYDAHGAIGQDFRSVLAQKEIMVNGKLEQVTPLIHHDANNLNGKQKLVPVAVNDLVVRNALIGPRDGTSIRGEAGLKNQLHTQLRNLLVEEALVGPAPGGEEGCQYDENDYSAVDAIRTSFQQLAGIGLAKDKQGNQVYTADGQLVFETRPGLHDDGAYCHVYATIGHLALRNRLDKAGIRPRSTTTPILTNRTLTPAELDCSSVQIQRLTIA